MDFIRKHLRSNPYIILEQIIPQKLIDAAMHRLQLDLFKDGISKREILWWSESANWFPHLRFDPAILALRDALPAECRTGEPCEPQILVGTPQEQDCTPYSHIDKEPEWANGRKYDLIVGVPLTFANKENGGVRAWLSDSAIFSPELSPGDVWIMRPDLPHSGGPNLSGGARYVVYFRWLK